MHAFGCRVFCILHVSYLHLRGSLSSFTVPAPSPNCRDHRRDYLVWLVKKLLLSTYVMIAQYGRDAASQHAG